MKKLFGILIAASLMFGLVSCAQTDSNHTASGETAPMDDEDNEWGIVLSAEDVTPKGMTLVCTQSDGHYTGELYTGSPYVIEQVVNGIWLPLDTKLGLDRWAWTMEGWIIRPNDTTKWEVNWAFLYGELGPGVYRIRKEIMNFRGPGDYTEKPYYAEFAIVD